MPVRISRSKLQRIRWRSFFGGSPRCPQVTRIGYLLAGVFVLSILDYTDTALARPAHQVSREGKSQSQSKSEKVEGVRPRASARGTDAATSSQTPPHLDSKQNPVEPAPALVNRQQGQGQRFHVPSPRHDFTAVPHPLAQRDVQPPVRNSIGVSIPSNNINSRTAPSVPNSRPIVPETFSVQHGATSRIGSINTRPVAPGGPVRGAASLPTTSRTAAINGTGIMRRGIGSPQIGGPAR